MQWRNPGDLMTIAFDSDHPEKNAERLAGLVLDSPGIDIYVAGALGNAT